MLAVTFRVGSAAYAIPCDRVVAVIPQVELRPTAHSSAWLKGVFAYRGELTPVIDLCQLIAGQPCPARLSSRIALVRAARPDGGARLIGLLAEQMTEARRIENKVVAAPALAPLPYFGDVLLEAGEPLQFLEVDALLTSGALGLAGAPDVPRITAGEEDREPTQP